MPNHTFHSMDITGEPTELIRFVAKHFIDDEFNFDSIIPMPTDLKDTTSPPKEPNPELVAKHGADNWYDWKVKNWGTKWGAYDCTLDFSDTDIIRATFQTAWNTPMPIFEKLGELYPELMFCLEVVDEGGYFGGTVDIVEGGVIEDLTEAQWKEYAVKLTGYEDTEAEDMKERIIAVLDDLKKGNFTDQGVILELVNFTKCNINDFIKFSCPNITINEDE